MAQGRGSSYLSDIHDIYGKYADDYDTCLSQPVKKRGGKPNKGGGRGRARGGGGGGGGGGRGGRGGGRGGGGRGSRGGSRGRGRGRQDGREFGGRGGGGMFVDRRGGRNRDVPTFRGYDDPDVISTKNTRSALDRDRSSQTKVPMQHLYMSMDNQSLVRDVLYELHTATDISSQKGRLSGDEEYDEDEEGDNFAEGNDEMDEVEEYCSDREDSASHAVEDEQYWLTEGPLIIQHKAAYAEQDSEDDPGDPAPSHNLDLLHQRRVDKLQRYGFEKKRCVDALEASNADIGKALEHLLKECFRTSGLLRDGNIDETAQDMDELHEQRQEEMTALSSIYPESFSERVANQVWVLQLELSYLSEFVKRQKMEGKKERKTLVDDDDLSVEICRFFLSKKGCRFGRRCKYRHVNPYRDPNKSEETDISVPKSMYELEIRFPVGNKYPFEPPLLAFSTTNPLVPNYMCLNITKYLMEQASDEANLGMPIVFTLVSLFDNEDEILAVCWLEPSEFSLPKPVISRHEAAAMKKMEDLSVTHIKDRPTKEIHPEKTGGASVSTADTSLDDLDDDSANRQEEYRKRYGRQEIVTRKTNKHQIQRDNVRLKAKFMRLQESNKYQAMLEVRNKLPAWNKQDAILQAIQQSQVVVISGMTGCGKTTQVPQFILDSYLWNRNSNICNIVCTQPRRISAMAVAQRVADERVEKLGGVVGYQIRLESVMSSSTRLLFCTTGILLRRLEGDVMLEDVSHVILDEVHERSEESDFLLMVLRDLLRKRRDLKIILMSATLNADLFSTYFGGCPVIEIEGKTFPVEQYFMEDVIEMTGYVMDEQSTFARPLKNANAVAKSGVKGKSGSARPALEDIEDTLHMVSHTMLDDPPMDNLQDQNLSVKQLFLRYIDYKKSTVKTMAIMDHEKINYDLIESVLEFIVDGDHEYPRDGAILVFLPGLQEITTMYEQLNTSSTFGGRNKSRFLIIPLHSTLSSEDQQVVFRRPKEGVVKIVLSTNIAETSITIDDVVFVIDSGRMKEKRYDATKGMESLDTVWVSRANAQQRKGRAGRVAHGVCFHLFSSHRYEFHFQEQPIPEIQRVPLEQIILCIKILDLFRDENAEDVLGKLIEPPAPLSILTSHQRLQDLGALDLEGYLTPLGYHLASLPVDVRIGKLMLFGAIFRCLDSALTIAAALSYKSPFVSPFDKREEADNAKQSFAIGNSDHLTMLKAYKGWSEAQTRGSRAGWLFCQDNFLSIKTLQMLSSMKQQYVELLSDIGFIQESITLRDVQRASRGHTDGVAKVTGTELNSNNDNTKLVAAILVAALYPNIVQVMTPEAKYQQTGGGVVQKAPKPEELRFATKSDGYVFVHPSSINFQVRYYETPYLVYHEKVKTTKVYIRDCTMVSVYSLLFFGGGSINIDLDRGAFLLSIDDGWIRFKAQSNEVAQLVKELRLELDHLLQDKIEEPNMNLATCPRGSRIITTIVKLITTQ